jgi:hypothetical protein
MAPASPTWKGSQLVGDSAQRGASVPDGAGSDAARAIDSRDRRVEILRALERGEIDVDEAGRRLEMLDEQRA